ncbi:MAG: DNA cytosine methyltransferase [Candidatus Methanofastidiosum sp.]|nr:DNA cytosine methyltransferase [Methanofastidiosum sp.]
MRPFSRKLTAIDLFCGSGGLTVGLKEAGFNVVLGLEISPEISKIYAANHPEVKIITRDIRNVNGKEILELTGLKNIDLIAGCPPCQGFTSLTYKYRREDPRNQLILEMARIIEEIKPKMVMMENVPGITKRGKPLLDMFVNNLNSLGYICNMEILQMADFGVPQNRKRFVLLAGNNFRIEMPDITHCQNGNNKNNLKPWLNVSDVLIRKKKPLTISVAKSKGGPQRYNWHVVRDLKEISIRRLDSLKEGDSRASLPLNLRPKCHLNSNRGFVNVYGRLRWDQIPPTMTSGFCSPCRGRFSHPEESRTISVREAANIQTFPNRYIFDTNSIDLVCEVIGNALPCLFAKQAAIACLNSYKIHGGLN